jgi:hypothetical protein
MWCRRRYICGAADECFVLFRIGVRVTIRLPVGQSVSPSIRLGVEHLLGLVTKFLCTGKDYHIVLGRPLIFMNLIYIFLDERSTQDNRRTESTQRCGHTASGILTV